MPDPRRWCTLAVLCVVLCMALTDVSIVKVARPPLIVGVALFTLACAAAGLAPL